MASDVIVVRSDDDLWAVVGQARANAPDLPDDVPVSVLIRYALGLLAKVADPAGSAYRAVGRPALGSRQTSRNPGR
jgi:hypothetical protein